MISLTISNELMLTATTTTTTTRRRRKAVMYYIVFCILVGSILLVQLRFLTLFAPVYDVFEYNAATTAAAAAAAATTTTTVVSQNSVRDGNNSSSSDPSAVVKSSLLLVPSNHTDRVVVDQESHNYGNVTTVVTTAATATATAAATATVLRCLLDIEKPLMKLQHGWHHSNVPIMHSMIQVNGTYKIIFILYFMKSSYDSWTQPGHSVWTCNGVPSDTSSTEPGMYTEQGYAIGRSIFVLDCPLDVHTITANRTHFPGAMQYKTDILRKCADLDDTKGLPQPKAPHKIACTMIQGTHKELREWIEYNRLIGFEHFLIYVNEPYNATLLPQSSDITYIPWDYTFGERELGKPHQSAQLNDCQLRALARNVTWVGIMDVDEYFHVLDENNNNNNNNNNSSSSSSSSNSLDEVLRSHEEDVTLGGLQIPSWFYGHKIIHHTGPAGRGVDVHVPSRYDKDTLVMDGVWRMPGPCRYGREKLLIRPSHVNYLTPHKIESGGPMKTEPRIRMHHYKFADREEVFSNNKNNNVRRQAEIEFDDSLVRQYGPLLRQRLGMAEKNYNNNNNNSNDNNMNL